ncbi:MAG TPA: hypothetical protein VIX86_22670 [Streptosporangiaceae bacterium]
MAPQAGYSGTPLPRKLGVKPGDEVAVLGGPGRAAGVSGRPEDMTAMDRVAAEIAGLPGLAPVRRELSGSDPLDVIVVFVTQRADLAGQLAGLRARMAPAAGLWVAWPKRASGVATDMTEHVVREIALPTGLVDNKVCAIDQTWSGLRLVIRRELRPGGPGQ